MAFTTREGRTQTALAEINMIPFIDIVLVLLIIFMVTAPVIQSGIEVNVPKTQIVRELAEEKLVVTLDKEQRLYLQRDRTSMSWPTRFMRSFSIPHVRVSICARTRRFPGAHLRSSWTA